MICIRRSNSLLRLAAGYKSDAHIIMYFKSISLISSKIARRFIHHHKSTPVSKLCPDAKTALKLSGLKSGDTIAVGGFGNGGIPETLLHELSSQEDDGPTNLTVVSLTAGVDNFGLGRLFEAGKVKRMISSYVGENKVSKMCLDVILLIVCHNATDIFIF